MQPYAGGGAGISTPAAAAGEARRATEDTPIRERAAAQLEPLRHCRAPPFIRSSPNTMRSWLIAAVSSPCDLRCRPVFVICSNASGMSRSAEAGTAQHADVKNGLMYQRTAAPAVGAGSVHVSQSSIRWIVRSPCQCFLLSSAPSALASASISATVAFLPAGQCSECGSRSGLCATVLGTAAAAGDCLLPELPELPELQALVVPRPAEDINQHRSHTDVRGTETYPSK